MNRDLRTHPSVVKFLDRVCARLSGEKRKAEVREELLSHLEAELAESGISIEEIENVIARFGDPEALGANLRRAQRTWMQKLFRFTALGLAFSFLLLYFSSRHFFNFYDQKIKAQAAKLASHLQRFESEQEAAAGLPLFIESTTGLKADAGQYLNDRLAQNELRVPEPDGGPWIRGWLKEPIPDSLKQADLKWIAILKDFDHWDFFTFGPNAKLIGPHAQAINPFSTPIPDLRFLQAGARLHLRRGLDSGNILPALKDVRHLARLSYTTETLIGSMVAIALLKMESTARDVAVKRRIISAEQYETLSVESLDRIRKTLWVTAGFADYSAPAQARRAFLDGRWPVGACAALGESANSYVLAASYLGKVYPFEQDMRERLQVVDELMEKSKPYCRLSFSRQSVARHKEYAQTMLDEAFTMADGIRGNFEKYRFVLGRHLPYFRQALGLELIAVARPSFTLIYENEP